MRTNEITVTLVGSFKNKPAALRQVFDNLHENFRLLSPTSIDFVDEEAGFLRTPKELDKSVAEIENQHLTAINNSDFVFLFAPDGYVGLSGAFEVGYAYALGVPIIASEQPTDVTIKEMISVVAAQPQFDPTAVHPGKALSALQLYYKRVAVRRNWNEEEARDILLLMTEELGELARSIRKHHDMRRDTTSNAELSHELADVQLYLVHLSNNTGIDLSQAITEKETINRKRFDKD